MEWILVHKKRGPRGGPQGGYGAFPSWKSPRWGMDRAHGPWGGFPPGPPFFPNYQPAPPHEASRAGGPPSIPKDRTCKQGSKQKPKPKQNNTRRNPHQGGNPKYIQPDGDFKNKIRVFHALIKVIHHGENIRDPEKGNPPKIIQHMIDVMSLSIKPALPTPEIRDLIQDSAREWGYNIRLILKQHYEERLKELQGEISQFHSRKWEEPFHVAVGWARKKLPRLQEATLEKARDIINTLLVREHPQSQSEPESYLDQDDLSILDSPGTQLQVDLDSSEPESPEAIQIPGPQPPLAKPQRKLVRRQRIGEGEGNLMGRSNSRRREGGGNSIPGPVLLSHNETEWPELRHKPTPQIQGQEPEPTPPIQGQEPRRKPPVKFRWWSLEGPRPTPQIQGQEPGPSPRSQSREPEPTSQFQGQEPEPAPQFQGQEPGRKSTVKFRWLTPTSGP